MPTVANGGNPFGGSVPGQGAAGQVDESAFKNMWNFNLADAAFGYLVLEVEAGRIGTEMRAQGFNFAHRGTGGKQGPQPNQVPQPGVNAGPPNMGGAPQNRPPIPQQQSQQNQQANQGPRAQPATPVGSAQNKPPALPERSVPSPIPAAPAQVKPATPQPTSGTTVNLPTQQPEKSAASASVEPRNGATPSGDKSSAGPPKPSSPAVEKKPSTGLFIHNLENEQAVRDIFPDEDKANILKIEKYGKTNHVVHFTSHETAKAALDRQPMDHKTRNAGPPAPGQPRKANVKWYDDRGQPRTSYTPRDGQTGQAGTWQASNRATTGPSQRGGYQSGASDSEGGRGRGGYRGSRGGRGGERGDRGSGRGGRGGGRGRGEGTASESGTGVTSNE